jgi:hypothetical protein
VPTAPAWRLLIGCVAIGVVAAGCGGTAGTHAPSGVVGAPVAAGETASVADNLGPFCSAVRAMSSGITPAATPEGVAEAHARVNALPATAPAQLRLLTLQMAIDYNAVIDAFVEFGYNAQRVLSEASPQVQGTLRRLAAEASGSALDPEATVFGFAQAHCPSSTGYPSDARTALTTAPAAPSPPSVQGPASPPGNTFTYTLTGSASAANVTYMGSAGLTVMADQHLGWVKTLPVNASRASMLTAVILPPGGSVTCTITEGGTVLVANTATGPGQTASCVAILR